MDRVWHRLSMMLLALAFCPSLTSSAAPVWHTSTIRQIYPQADGSFILLFSSDSSNCTNPNSPKYYAVVVGQNSMTAEGAKKIYAAAMFAMALNKTVMINFESQTSSCYINRLVVQ